MKTKKFDVKAMLRGIDFSGYKLGNRRLQVFYAAVEEEDRHIAKLCDNDHTYFGSYKTFLQIIDDTIDWIGAYEGGMFDLIPDLVTCTEKEATIIVLVKRKN